jgi:membrane protein DedA with SNARE-associated domain/membrane-associated phospholipid phosphatase
MHNYFHALSAWLHLHPQWAAAFTLLVAFLECIPIIGTIVPGSVLMTAIGVLIGSGIVSFWVITLCSIIGAVIGDSLGFFLGYRYKEQIKSKWPFKTHPEWLAGGQKFIVSHGGKSIFLGRFVGPVRAFIPLIAGMLHLPPARFFAIDVSSAICWSVTYMIPGILLGMASLSIPPELAARIIIAVLVMLVLIWIITWLLHAISKKLYHWFNSHMDNLWLKLKNNHRLHYLYNFLSLPDRKEHSGQLAMACVCAGSIILFFMLWLNVILHGPLTYWNNAFYHLFLGLHDPRIAKIMLLITTFGENVVILPVSFMLFIWLAYHKNWRVAWHCLAIGVLAALATAFFKHFFFSIRPPCLLNGPQTSSFPSGHVTLSIAIYGFLAYLLGNIWHQYKKIIYIITAIICTLIALSRIYLCAHWFTDLVGGLLLGLICLSIVIISYRRHKRLSISGIGLSIVAAVTLLISGSGYLYTHYTMQVQNYQLVWPHYLLDETGWWQQSENIDEIPLYRNTRLGYPARILNVQWADSLDNIRHTLSQHGWQVLPADNLTQLLKQLLEADKSKHLAVVEQLKQDQLPELVAIKKTNSTKDNKNAPALLLLWPANITLTPSNVSLWVGSLYYYQQESYHLFQHRNTVDKEPAIPTLLASLGDDIYKSISIDSDQLPLRLSNELVKDDFNVFMIRRKL